MVIEEIANPWVRRSIVAFLFPPLMVLIWLCSIAEELHRLWKCMYLLDTLKEDFADFWGSAVEVWHGRRH